MHNKRGISTIIATLLLVALTIVLIAIVWVVIKNVVSSASSGITLNGLTLDLKIQNAQIGSNNISVVVQRQPGAGTLVGINFVVFNGVAYESIEQNTSLDVYQGEDFIVIPTQMDVSTVKTISVAPIYPSSSGQNQTGGITDTYTFGIVNNSGGNNGGGTNGSNGGNGGNGGSTCTPASNPTFAALCTNNGYTCGDVNNGTCSPVSCGSCGSGQTCSDNTCISNAGGSTCTPASNPTFAALCTNNGYTCENVNNGTCSVVSCGTCGSGQICNISDDQCISGGEENTCTPASNPTFAALCTNNGYTCGDVNNGTCSPVSCGSCGSGQICNLSDYQCVTGGNSCIPTTCALSGYQCGTPSDGCGGTLTCPSCTGINSFCNSSFKCDTYKMINSGTILSIWPPNAAIFFDSSDLPTDIDTLTTINDGQHYVRFPGSSDTGCIQIVLANNEPSPSNISYISLASVANVIPENNYQIWDSNEGCILHPGYS